MGIVDWSQESEMEHKVGGSQGHFTVSKWEMIIKDNTFGRF